jgi:uncharacterized protein (TIGR03086 family)
MALPDDPAGRHRQTAAAFLDVASAVPNWDAPTPVAGWTAADVVDHLVSWSTSFLASAWQAPVADPGSDWATRFRVHADGIQQLLDQRASADLRLSNPHIGEVSLPEAIDRFYTSDVFMHTWDLGRSAGVDVVLDPDECSKLLRGMVAAEEMLRASGQFGPAFPVSEDATVADRLVAFIGRDPSWDLCHRPD